MSECAGLPPGRLHSRPISQSGEAIMTDAHHISQSGEAILTDATRSTANFWLTGSSRA